MTRNEKIFEKGTIRKATRTDIINIVLGPLEDLKEVKGVIEFDETGANLYTRKNSDKSVHYPLDYIATLKVVGTKSTIKKGRYDIAAYSPQDMLKRRLGTLVSVEPLLTLGQSRELAPILESAKEVIGFQKFSHDRKAIIITPEMDVNYCFEDNNDEPTPILVGDAFIVKDEEEQKGYKIEKNLFEETHKVY